MGIKNIIRKMQFKTRKFDPDKTRRSVSMDNAMKPVLDMLLGIVGGDLSPSQAMDFYKTVSAVSIPVNKIADNVADLDIIVQNISTGETVPGNQVLELLKRPNPWESLSYLLRTLSIHYLVTGNFYPVALGFEGSAPIELGLAVPRNVTVSQGLSDYRPSEYMVSGQSYEGDYIRVDDSSNRTVRYITRDNLLEIAHGKELTGSSQLGISRLSSAWQKIVQITLGDSHNANTLQKGGRMSLAVMLKQQMDQQNFKAVEEYIVNKFGGADGESIGVINAKDVEIQEMGTNNKDMEYSSLYDRATQAIAMVYNVPLPLVTTESMTYNNYTEAKLALYDDAVLPTAKIVLETLSHLLLPRFGLDSRQFRLFYDEDHISTLQTRRREELKLRREIGLETTNELRGVMGYDRVEGGDELLVNATQVPLSQVAANDEDMDTPGLNDG